MIQTLTTLISLMLAAGAVAVITLTLAEEWTALRHALVAQHASALAALPARTRRVAGAHRARIVRISLESAASRAAA